MHDFKVNDPLDIWDSFRPRDLQRVYPLVLFGNRDIGDESRCNTRIGGRTFGDQRLVVNSWRARTNIDVDSLSAVESAAWLGWTNSTTCDLVVGGRLVLSAPVSELLSTPTEAATEAATLSPAVVRHALRVFTGSSASDISVRDQLQEMMLRDMSISKDHSVNSLAAVAATTAWRLLADIPSVLIPERQCYHVAIKSEPRSLRALLEVLPTTATPESLVWVHIQGSNIHGGS